jgi:hypothetical protein
MPTHHVDRARHRRWKKIKSRFGHQEASNQQTGKLPRLHQGPKKEPNQTKVEGQAQDIQCHSEDGQKKPTREKQTPTNQQQEPRRNHPKQSRRQAQRRLKRKWKTEESTSTKINYQITQARIDNATFQAQRECQAHYGYAANDQLPLWQNRYNALIDMPVSTYFNQQTNKAYHNLCTTLRPPPNLTNLLGLGEKFCLELKRPKIDTSATIDRLKHSLRLRHLFSASQHSTTRPATN